MYEFMDEVISYFSHDLFIISPSFSSLNPGGYHIDEVLFFFFKEIYGFNPL